MPAARFAKLIEQLQSFPIRHSVILQTLRLTLALGCEERWEGGGTRLIHFGNTPLDFWLRLSQKLEERGDPWEESSTLL
jgi:hypothetical protein